MLTNETNAATIYDTFWKDLIEVDGQINLEQLQKELADFYLLIDNISKVYDHITNGQVSIPLTDPNVVIRLSDDCYGGLIHDADVYGEYIEDYQEFKEWLKNR